MTDKQRPKKEKKNSPFETPGECVLPWDEAEGDVETRVDGLAEAVAAWTEHVALKQPAESAVHDAVALEERRPARARVRRVEQRDQTLVRILLRVAGQGTRGAPGGSEQRGGAERGLRRQGVRVGGGEEAVELAAGAVFFVLAPARVVLVAEEVVPQERVVQERLEGRVEEARLAQVEQAALALAGKRDGVVECGDVLRLGFPGLIRFARALFV